jgi:hypothetical protein
MKDPYADHRRFYAELALMAPAANVELMKALQWKQPGRYKRVRNTLIGLQVVQFHGRGGSARLALGKRALDDALAQQADVHVGREVDLYPLLVDPIDRLITQWYPPELGRRFSALDSADGVTPYITASARAGQPTGAHTRPDITVIVDMQFPSLGPWNDVHAIEVKPYWSVERDGLFEAAAQAALRRCTHSWLVAYLPDPKAPGLDRAHAALAKRARAQIGAVNAPGPLSLEANSIGIGVAVATSLAEDTSLETITSPARQVMEPDRANDLFASLGRADG